MIFRACISRQGLFHKYVTGEASIFGTQDRMVVLPIAGMGMLHYEGADTMQGKNMNPIQNN